MTTTPEFLTLEEVCAAVGIDPATFHRWRKKGIAPASYKLGNKRLVTRDDFNSWLARNREDRRAS